MYFIVLILSFSKEEEKLLFLMYSVEKMSTSVEKPTKPNGRLETSPRQPLQRGNNTRSGNLLKMCFFYCTLIGPVIQQY